VINAHHGIDQATLGRAIGLDKVTTSQLVRGLEERPMLTRGMPIIDAVSLKLTTAGIALLDTAEPCIEDAYQRLRCADVQRICAARNLVGHVEQSARIQCPRAVPAALIAHEKLAGRTL
jgi:DNA-binding MarR family transcriptional regulator